jgi:sugar lactone lactonase YvrE
MTVSSVETLTPPDDVLGEGPVWSIEEQVLYWVDIDRGLVRRLEPATGELREWRMGTGIGCLRLRDRGGAVVALATGFHLLDLETGALTLVADPERSDRVLLNDGACDDAGRMWCASYDVEEREPIGSLWRLDAGGTVHRMAGGLLVGNGVDWSPDGRTMYVTDSGARTITAYDFAPDGTIARPRVVVREPGVAQPDGLTVDAEGYLWSTKWDGARVVRHAPDGSVDRVVHLPVRRPTACAFGGPGLDELYVTTARWQLTPGDLASEPAAGSLLRLRPGVQGLPARRYAG